MHYFAYGTLLLEDSMKRVAPSAKNTGYMKLMGHRMGFGKCTQPDLAGCTLETDPDAVTWGIQFELSEEDMANLDKAAMVDKRQWVHFPIELIDSEGNTVKSSTYVIPDNPEGWIPTKDYVEPIFEGLKSCDFPQHYKDGLRTFLNNQLAGSS